MGSFDSNKSLAKPPKHKDTDGRAKSDYEHEQIIDNRLTWEVLEEGEECS